MSTTWSETARARPGVRRRRWGVSTPTLFVLPSAALILGITIFPTLWALVLSFFQWDLQNPDHPFVGLANYVAVLVDPLTLASVRFTLSMAIVLIVIDLAAGMSLALLLSGDRPGKGLFVSILLLPIMVSPVVAGYSWRIMFDTRLGPVNQVISLIRGTPTFIPWLNDVALSMVAIIVVNIWQSTPFIS